MKEADELLEVLFSREVMTTVGPYGLEKIKKVTRIVSFTMRTKIKEKIVIKLYLSRKVKHIVKLAMVC